MTTELVDEANPSINVGPSAAKLALDFETLNVRQEGGVLFADIAAPPMNLLGPELVRDLVSLIQRAEADDAARVLVFTGGSGARRASRDPTRRWSTVV